MPEKMFQFGLDGKKEVIIPRKKETELPPTIETILSNILKLAESKAVNSDTEEKEIKRIGGLVNWYLKSTEISEKRIEIYNSLTQRISEEREKITGKDTAERIKTIWNKIDEQIGFLD
ncbi:MAG: hypothetical protein M1127_02640 [Patescibacteria group bacterium]|nr:hypothetical protein [Patescibacteria group bacterium]